VKRHIYLRIAMSYVIEDIKIETTQLFYSAINKKFKIMSWKHATIWLKNCIILTINFWSICFSIIYVIPSLLKTKQSLPGFISTHKTVPVNVPRKFVTRMKDRLTKLILPFDFGSNEAVPIINRYTQINVFVLVFMVFNSTFNNNIVAVSFIGGRYRNARRKPPTCLQVTTNSW
jgi:hypothetical protein